MDRRCDGFEWACGEQQSPMNGVWGCTDLHSYERRVTGDLHEIGLNHRGLEVHANQQSNHRSLMKSLMPKGVHHGARFYAHEPH